MHHRSGFTEEHPATNDATETRGAVLRYDSYEIRACVRIIVTSQSNRMSANGTASRWAHLPKVSQARPQATHPRCASAIASWQRRPSEARNVVAPAAQHPTTLNQFLILASSPCNLEVVRSLA